MFALLEIARIYKALKRFADLQGPICYNDAQNKEINLTVYYSGAPARAKRARSGAPCVRKFGKLSIRENLVMT